MKRTLSILAAVAALGLTSAAFAGPSTTRIFAAGRVLTVPAQPAQPAYALTGQPQVQTPVSVAHIWRSQIVRNSHQSYAVLMPAE